eukprot:TRINITY_DN26640_c0_g1_i1.p1 TRINITY_DN26640_c0_g1~~TRINITY_DN26640_c0_g1_i1.p1  ORF type:complete len:595 (-),score=65.32 TRINITY_DN26640_c0_g1_i1:639-2342(-)
MQQQPSTKQYIALAVLLVWAIVVAFVTVQSVTFVRLTAGQIACLLIFVPILTAWCIVHSIAAIQTLTASKPDAGKKEDEQDKPPADEEAQPVESEQKPKAEIEATYRSRAAALLGNAAEDERVTYLNNGAEWACIFFVVWVCDRTPLVTKVMKSPYNPDQFWFLWVALGLLGFVTLKKIKINNPNNHAAPLQRDQTEEWKGWMQIAFLLYHYFQAAPLYNAIRLFIAAYVWMTGFGNFSYYYIRKDFSFTRFCQMMWRLNFMVIFLCAIMENDYMLYYICMLHTLFTVVLVIAMGIKAEQWNYKLGTMTTKFVVLAIITGIIWEVPGVFEIVWAPFRWLVDYHNPARPDDNPLHEWKFRSTLDHWVWIVGMLTAYNFPRGDELLQKLDSLDRRKQIIIKTIVTVACGVVTVLWFQNVYLLNKFEYNSLHPYTSWVPITIYIIMRNLFSVTRHYYLGVFAWLGKLTLETYLLQFHVWMATPGPNGNPKRLLQILPAEYPMMNFVLFSAFYLFLSYRCKAIVDSLKCLVIPNDKDKAKRNIMAIPVVVVALYVVALGITMTAAVPEVAK